MLHRSPCRRALTAALSFLVLCLVPAAAGAATSATGEAQSCGISAGALTCWGADTGGALGTGTNLAGASVDPLPVAGMGSGVTDVALTATGGGTNTTGCAIRSGAALCWSDNSWGQLGDGTTTPRNAPVQVSGLTSGVTKISVNTSHVCAVQNGAAFCWGAGQGGILGDNDGTIHNQTTPVTPSGLGSGVTDIAAGWRHTCAIQTGVIKCWGNNTNSQLGYGGPYSTGYTWVPRPLASPPPGTPVKIAAGSETNCALMDSGAVYCWGSNDAGKLGAGSSLGDSVTPLQVTGLSAVTDVHINANHACALQGGAAFCWGDGQQGKLGNNPPSPQGNDASTPQAVVGLSGITSIATGNDNTCATAAGQQYCWGSNQYGQLGTDQVVGFSGVPVRVTGTTSNPGPTPVPTPAPAPLPPVVTAPPALAAKITTPARGTSRLSKARLATIATIACPPGAACRVSAPKTVKVKIRERRFTLVVLGTGAIAPGGKAIIRVRLTKAAAQRLRKKTVKVTLRLTTTVNGAVASRSLTVKVAGRG
jgi:alpha-tubulin suppressor-like RCC1 family protein